MFFQEIAGKIIPETYFLAQEQLLLFGGACLLGIPAAIALDILRVVRTVIPHHAIIVAIEDIMFCILCGFLLLCYTFAFARGEFRMFYAAGCLLGFVIYECAVGTFSLKCIRKLVGMFRKTKRIAPICRKQRGRFVKTTQKKEMDKKKYKSPCKKHLK